MWRQILTAALVLVAASRSMHAESPSAPARVVVYPIGDLLPFVAPPSHHSVSATAQPLTGTDPTQENSAGELSLINYLAQNIQHASQGADGFTMRFYPIGHALVVRGPQHVQEQVAGLLEQMRHATEPCMSYKLVAMSVSQEFFERFGLNDDLRQAPNNGCYQDPDTSEGCHSPESVGGRSVVLNEGQVKLLVSAVSDDPSCRLLATPTFIKARNCPARFEAKEQHHFVTGVTIRARDGQLTVVPEWTELETGLIVEFHDQIDATRGGAALSFRSIYSYLHQPPTCLPVTMMCPAVGPTEESHSPAPMTQFLQEPTLRRITAAGEIFLKEGETALIYGGQIEQLSRKDRQPAWLSKIPYLDRLLNWAPVVVRRREHLLYLVSLDRMGCPSGVEPAGASKAGPRSCPAGEKCADVVTAAASSSRDDEATRASAGPMGVTEPGSSCSEPGIPAHRDQPPARLTAPLDHRRIERVAAQLVSKYHAACASGDLEQAREFAQMALDLDPSCFSKPYAAQVAPTSQPMLVPAGSTGLRPASAVAPTEDLSPHRSTKRPHQPSLRRETGGATEPTVDYFPIPLVPIFSVPETTRSTGLGQSVRPVVIPHGTDER